MNSATETAMKRELIKKVGDLDKKEKVELLKIVVKNEEKVCTASDGVRLNLDTIKPETLLKLYEKMMEMDIIPPRYRI